MRLLRVFNSKEAFFCRLGLVVLLLCCSSWGFFVHKTVAQLAIYQLPKQMRSFFYMNKSELVQQAPRPDLRRNTDPAEAPRHFIDLESYGDSSAWKMPMHEEEAVRIYSWDTLKKYGYVPYEILRMKELLTEAFRNGKKDSIVFYATDLGHYIGDANVPLHVSVNYDGQLTGQNGLHSLWETLVPVLESDQYKLYEGHKAHYLSDPAVAIWEAVRHTATLVPTVFEVERQVSVGFTDSTKYVTETRNGRKYKNYSSAFAKAYGQRLGTMVNEQLLRSSNLIADFWYTSWVDAGRPGLGNLLAVPFERKDRRAFRKEYKAYKNNRLIKDSLLLSKLPL